MTLLNVERAVLDKTTGLPRLDSEGNAVDGAGY
jgi:hypothetical protein